MSPAPVTSSAAEVPLVAAPAALARQCFAAATKIGFAVPCPALIPALRGRALSCPPSEGGAAALPPCVGFESDGQLGFFLQLAGFDVPPNYVGVDGRADGHMLVEARPHRASPSRPCIGAKKLGTVTAGTWTTVEYGCPVDSPLIEREATHGEGAYTGHLLLTWSHGGIDYLASLHGVTNVNLTVLEQLVAAMTLVAPRPTSTPTQHP